MLQIKTDSELSTAVEEAITCLPKVFSNLQKHGLLCDFLALIHFIDDDKFPMDNISLQLLLEVARWYNKSSISQMCYSVATQLFWKVGYKMFHGKFLRYMSGEKSQGTELSNKESKGNHDPQLTNINFAMPSIGVVRNFQHGITLPKELLPGIIMENIMLRSGEKNSFILGVDGKLVAT